METASGSPGETTRRDAMLEALAFAAQRFLERPTWSECLDDVVRRLGESVGASRAYVFENHPPGDQPVSATLRSQWLAANTTSPFAPGDALGYDDLERWIAACQHWIEVATTGSCRATADFRVRVA